MWKALLPALALALVCAADRTLAASRLDEGRALLAAAVPVTGEGVRASILSGRPVIVTFFASWCPPCTQEFEALNAVRERYSADGLAIVAVNVFEDFGGRVDAERMQRFLDRTGPQFAVVEGSEALRTAFGAVTRIPTLIIFDARGNEAWRFVHAEGATKRSATAAEIEAVLDTFQAGE